MTAPAAMGGIHKLQRQRRDIYQPGPKAWVPTPGSSEG